MKKRLFTGWFMLAVLLFAVGCGQTASAPKESNEKPFYEGKTINLIVPFTAGGGTDSRARLVASHLSEFLPGKPQVLVVNKPGGGGAIAFNQLATSTEPDGLTIGVASAGIPVRWVRGEEGHDYPLDKMQIIAAFSAASYHYGHPQLGSLKEMVERGQAVTTGHTDLSSSIAVVERLVGDLLGLQFEQTGGYKGYSETKLAVLRGEVQMSGGETDQYVTDLKNYTQNVEIVSLFQSGLIHDGKISRDPRMPDVPTLEEAYKEIHGKSPEDSSVWPAIRAMTAVETLGMSFWLPEGTPKERYTELTEAFEAMSKSSQYKESVSKQMGAEDVVAIGDQAHAAFRAFADIPEEVKQLLK